MSARTVWEVSRWEFVRYFHWRQQLVSLIVTIAMGLGTVGIMNLARRSDPVRIAVIGHDALPILSRATSELQLNPHAAAEESDLRTRVREKDLDGLLIVRDTDRAELFVRRRAGWTGDLRGALAAARQELMLARSGLTPEQLAVLVAPPRLDVLEATERAGTGRADRIMLVATVVLTMIVLFTGMSYMFVSITGEKQIRVTEQVVSAIPAQSWIDGKIIGIMGICVVTVLNMLLAGAITVAAVLLFRESGFSVPIRITDPVVFLVILLFGVLGLFFWFAYLGVIAALLDDPNTSTKGAWLFVPMLATSLAFMGLGNPEGGLIRTLSILPPTAPSAMPARMLIADVSAVEIAAALALLVVSVYALRIAAGRIFRLAMLMYGKEPTWGEVRRWAVERAEPGAGPAFKG